MIELRWIVRLKEDGNTEKVLQMRQEFDATIRTVLPGQIFQHPEHTKHTWSPWRDVPTFLEGFEYSNPQGVVKYAHN